MKIPVGELLEWIGAALLVTSAALYAGPILALAVAGAWILYYAQVIAAIEANQETK